MIMGYSAGKGVRFPANSELLSQVIGAMADVRAAVSAFEDLKSDRKTPDDVVRYLVSEGFAYSANDFGTSAYKAWATGNGAEQLRVAAIINSRGVLQVDIRNWYAV